MSQAFFQFRQFCVHHDRCAMKVGTDGVLIGAWPCVEGAQRILDIGSGTGLVSLMMAQRAPQAQVWGVEIDPEAVRQSSENVHSSPFSERVHIVHQDVRDFHPDSPFDCIVCNPPFYREHTVSPDTGRRIARSTSSLPMNTLFDIVKEILTERGCFHVIIPTSLVSDVIAYSLSIGLELIRRCDVHTVQGKDAKRSMLSFSKFSDIYKPIVQIEHLVLQDSDGNRSQSYQLLTSEFYL